MQRKYNDVASQLPHIKNRWPKRAKTVATIKKFFLLRVHFHIWNHCSHSTSRSVAETTVNFGARRSEFDSESSMSGRSGRTAGARSMADRSGTEITEYHSYMYAESQDTRYNTSISELTHLTIIIIINYFSYMQIHQPALAGSLHCRRTGAGAVLRLGRVSLKIPVNICDR